MRTSAKSYRDYGFQHNEEKYIKYLARQPNYEQRLLLYDWLMILFIPSLAV